MMAGVIGVVVITSTRGVDRQFATARRPPPRRAISLALVWRAQWPAVVVLRYAKIIVFGALVMAAY